MGTESPKVAAVIERLYEDELFKIASKLQEGGILSLIPEGGDGLVRAIRAGLSIAYAAGYKDALGFRLPPWEKLESPAANTDTQA